MKKAHTILLIFIIISSMILFFGNFALSHASQRETDNSYKVEINRIIADGADKFSADDYKYIKSVEVLSHQPDEAELQYFYRDSNSDHIIIFSEGKLLRFDYTRTEKRSPVPYVVFNVSAAVLILLVIIFVISTYLKVLMPFQRITGLPYELSKGNLSGELPENKSRLFGKFIWGLNLLRENLEEHKNNERELMRRNKTLILSISHDIKTPLSAIKLYAKALSKGLYTEEKRLDALKRIDLQADAINDAVNEIIKTSSEDFMSFETANDEFYLDSLIGKISEYYREKLSFARIDFSVGEFENCLISADFDRCIEVVENLMENAIKYGDGEKIELSFSQEDDFRLITVANTGCTLSETELSHIFDSFWRGSNSSNVSGSGLGLYISRTLMRKMGGDIFAQTEDGRFLITVVLKTA